MNKTIGFIGLGIMGKPMAKNVISAGINTVVWNRTASVMDELIQAGAKSAINPLDLAEQTDIIFLMLSNDAAVYEVVLGENGIVHAHQKPELIINTSTVSPETSIDISKQLAEKSIQYLEAPVTGSKVQAEEGALNFLVGGNEKVLEASKPIFSIIGKEYVLFR